MTGVQTCALPISGQPSSTAEPASKPGPVASASTASSAPEIADQPRSRVLPLALGAGALVLGGAALGFDLWGDRFYDRAKAATTQPDQDALYHSANARRYTAEALAVAAIGCAGAAAYLYFRGDESRTTTAFAPLVARDGAGLAVLGHW